MNDKIYNRSGKELITLQEAEELSIAKADTLRKQIFLGNLKAIKKGKTWFVIKDYVRKQSKN